MSKEQKGQAAPTFFESCIEVDGNIWFAGSNFICRMEPLTGKITPVNIFFPEINGVCWHEAILQTHYGSRLIFTPEYANRIIDFNTVTGERKEISFQCPELEPSKRTGGADFKFNSAIRLNKDVWFLPSSSKRILRYSPETMEVKDYTDWFDSQFAEFGWKDSFFGRGQLIWGNIIFPCREINAFCIFNPVDETFQVRYWGSENSRVLAYCEYNDQLWLADPLNREIVVLDRNWQELFRIGSDSFPLDFGIEKKYTGLIENFDDSLDLSVLIPFHGKLVGVPHFGNMFLLIDPKAHTISKLCNKPIGEYTSACIVNGNLYCTNQAEPEMIVIPPDFQVSLLHTEISDEALHLAQRMFFENIKARDDHKLMHEVHFLTLGMYLRTVVSN